MTKRRERRARDEETSKISDEIRDERDYLNLIQLVSMLT